MSTPTPGLPEEAAAPVSPAGEVPATPSPAVAAATPTFTPLTAPRPRATGGQITIAVIHAQQACDVHARQHMPAPR